MGSDGFLNELQNISILVTPGGPTWRMTEFLKWKKAPPKLQFHPSEPALLDSLQKSDSRSCCIDLSVSPLNTCVSIASRTAEIWVFFVPLQCKSCSAAKAWNKRLGYYIYLHREYGVVKIQKTYVGYDLSQEFFYFFQEPPIIMIPLWGTQLLMYIMFIICIWHFLLIYTCSSMILCKIN